MSTAPNPLIGASWGVNNAMNPSSNPLSLPGMGGYGPPGMGGGGKVGAGNPGGFGNPLGGKEINRNIILNNILAGQMKNQLAPQFAMLMGKYGGQAGDFFSQLMNLGSPYYKQKQAEGFTQGNQQNQNAQAEARQQLSAQGIGNTPSGTTAAMIGGMNQGGAQTLSEQYLQNLFQNENMQGQGAAGLAQLAQLFNPTQLLGGTSGGADPIISPSFFDNFKSIMSGLGDLGGGVGAAAKGLG